MRACNLLNLITNDATSSPSGRALMSNSGCVAASVRMFVCVCVSPIGFPVPYQCAAGAIPSLVGINTTFKWVDASQLAESETIELKERVLESTEYEILMRINFFCVCVLSCLLYDH